MSEYEINNVNKPRVSKHRWFMVAVLSWLNFSNAMLWIWYASISDVISNYYRKSLFDINMLSLAYPIVTVVLGIPSIWFIDKAGLLLTIICCGWLNAISGLLRFISTLTAVSPNLHFPLIVVAQILGGLAQPLAMFSPAKLAAVWFPSDQRVIGNTISAMGNPFGVFLGSLIPPLMSNQPLIYHNIILLVISMVGALMSTFGVRRSAPAQPPSHSADRQILEYGFLDEIKMSLQEIPFVVLTIVFGIAVGLFTAVSSLLQQILCPYGYDDKFAGLCGALLIGCGVLSSFFTGFIADRTKNLIGIIRTCMTLATFGFIAFAILTNFSHLQVPIAISIAWVGSCGVGLYSIALELGAEVTFPITEVVSNGILVISGQIFSIIFIIITQVTAVTSFNDVSNNCSSSATNQSYWISNLILAGFAVAASTTVLFFFHGKNRRLMNEAATETSEHDEDFESIKSEP